MSSIEVIKQVEEVLQNQYDAADRAGKDAFIAMIEHLGEAWVPPANKIISDLFNNDGSKSELKRPVHRLSHQEKKSLHDAILSRVKESPGQTYQELAEDLQHDLRWLSEVQVNYQGAIRDHCGILAKSGRVRIEGLVGDKERPNVGAKIYFNSEGSSEAVHPFIQEPRDDGRGTENGVNKATEITSDGRSQGASARGNGNPSHHPNGLQNGMNTVPQIGHNSASAGK